MPKRSNEPRSQESVPTQDNDLSEVSKSTYEEPSISKQSHFLTESDSND